MGMHHRIPIRTGGVEQPVHGRLRRGLPLTLDDGTVRPHEDDILRRGDIIIHPGGAHRNKAPLPIHDADVSTRAGGQPGCNKLFAVIHHLLTHFLLQHIRHL